MMNRNIRLLERSIPMLPQATSLINLTVRLGYICPESSPKAIEKAKRRALRKMAILTLERKDLVEMNLKLQKATREILDGPYAGLKCLAGYSPEYELYFAYSEKASGRRDG